MGRLIVSALVNGLIGAIGVVMTTGGNGQKITWGILLGAGLTGLMTALKDIHSFLQAPPS